MAVEVKPGETYTVQGARNGDTWSMFRVKAERGSKEITVFTEGNKDLKDGQKVKVEKIMNVKLSARKGRDRDGNEKWYDTYNVNAELSIIGGGGFEDIDDEGDLPF